MDIPSFLISYQTPIILFMYANKLWVLRRVVIRSQGYGNQYNHNMDFWIWKLLYKVGGKEKRSIELKLKIQV